MVHLLALDIGTTSVKAGLFNKDGVMLTSSLEEYQLLTPSPETAELDPEIYWHAAINTIQDVIARSKVEKDNILGITVSSQGETLILVNKDGIPLRNAIVWVDNRAKPQAQELNRLFGERVYDITGIPEVISTWPACKILWIRENEPEIFKDTDKFLLIQDYIIYRLTGQYVTDGSISCTTMFYDINLHQWWGDCLEKLGIQEEQLARINKPGAIAGELTPSAALTLGLSTSTKVICGGMDQSVGAIGSGNITPGIVSETTGAALAIQVSVDDPTIDATRSTPVYVHSVAQRYLFVPVCPTAGMAYKWFKDVFAKEEIDTAEKQGGDVYDLLNEIAGKVNPGSDGLVMLPHLMGAFSPIPNTSARGSFTGFTLLHKKGHFVRAILESVAFMLRQNLEVITKTGIKITEIRTSGGGSKSPLWNQIKADVCALPISRLENEDSALLGDAILAGVACGLFPSIEDACNRMVKIKERIVPGNDSTKYNRFYQRFLDLDKTMRNYFVKHYSENELN